MKQNLQAEKRGTNCSGHHFCSLLLLLNIHAFIMPALYELLLFCIFFWRARVCRPLLCLCRPFMIFEGCLYSNPEYCRSKLARYRLSHPFLYCYFWATGLTALAMPYCKPEARQNFFSILMLLSIYLYLYQHCVYSNS
jgi:hypothetical protein